MELNDFLAHLNNGQAVTGGSELHQFMHKVSNEAMKIKRGVPYTGRDQRFIFRIDWKTG